MEKLVSLCKRRGFLFQSSEIYGGLNGFWDYGPLGVELKRNIKDAWWRDMVTSHDELTKPDDGPSAYAMTGLDCTTYLETVVTLTRLAMKGKHQYSNYEYELENIRYREGKLDAYPSRLHYFSDWIYENEQKGIIKDVTEEIGGVAYENKPTFMSTHPQFYTQLGNETFVEELDEKEEEIAARNYHYIPKEDVEKLEKGIKSGDLIAITIDMDNLDISHVGFAVEQKGRIHLMHAGSKAKKVLISPVPLSDYLMGNKKQSGIMVCRMVEVGK